MRFCLLLLLVGNVYPFLLSPWTSSNGRVGPRTFADDFHIRLGAILVNELEQDGTKERIDREIRPFHQNWWPVAAMNSLDPSRPNAIEVLGKKLVAVYSANNDSWNVLDDRCSHRFAPLSEGRVVTNAQGKSCLQCAYHGWEFAPDSGLCTRVPQQESKSAANNANLVQTYPSQKAVGLLWVWMDPTTVDLSTTIRLPSSPLLKEHVDKFGFDACYMRDLPYGMELLGENLLDLSHLPFSHHSVGNLKRDYGGPLPTRMLSEQERIEYAKWEQQLNPDAIPVIPRYQAEIVDASVHDPSLISYPKRADSSAKAEWTSHVAFYDPSHVRYRRCLGSKLSIHVELFLCPLSEGRSRVFLYNIFSSTDSSDPSQSSPFSVLLKLKSKIEQMIVKKSFDPTSASSHIFAHKIFDGDGIFLHKQGNRMREADLTFRDYNTPTSADVLPTTYRRFLDQAAKKTRDDGHVSIVTAVVGTGKYGDDLERPIMLDRYNSHTKNCPVCLKALQSSRKQLSAVIILKTAMQGAAGASTVALLTLAAMAVMPSITVSSEVFPVTATAVCITWLLSFAFLKAEDALKKGIDQFLFEDYVHAEKN